MKHNIKHNANTPPDEIATIQLNNKYLAGHLKGLSNQTNNQQIEMLEDKILNSIRYGLDSRGDFFGHDDVLFLAGSENDKLCIPINKMPVTLGSGPSADFQIQGAGISRIHCKIEKKNCVLRLSDAKSLNGTYVNNMMLTSPIDLKEGDEITLGVVKLKVKRG